MINDNIYLFQGVSINVDTKSPELMHFINNYTFLKKTMKETTSNISYHFYENKNNSDCIKDIPEDAYLENDTEVLLGDMINFRRYSKGNSEVWNCFENFGTVYMNFDTKTIISKYCSKIDPQYITPFVILFIHPLIRILWDFGYTFLHAACIKVRNRNILITGVSGRGKSTASFALLKHGHCVITDESTLIYKKSGRYAACTITDTIKVRENALENLFGDLEKPHLVDEDEYIIKLTDMNNSYTREVDNIDHIFILEQTGEKKTIIEKTDPLSVIPELFPHTLFYTNKYRTDKTFDILTDLLNTTELSKVKFGTDMTHFAEEMENILFNEGNE